MYMIIIMKVLRSLPKNKEILLKIVQKEIQISELEYNKLFWN